ncbi:MAG: hypothetical protein WDN26_17275 [Chitinophagaceae bacterium]
MKNKISIFSFLLFCLYACNNSKDTPASESDVDAARNFIQAALEGDFEKAKTFMLTDSLNIERMNAIERVKLSPDEKKGLANASINIHEVSSKVKDSVTIVIYSNSFKNNWDTLKVVKHEGQWLVDFNYLFAHDSDSLSVPLLPKTDSTIK